MQLQATPYIALPSVGSELAHVVFPGEDSEPLGSVDLLNQQFSLRLPLSSPVDITPKLSRRASGRLQRLAGPQNTES